MWNYRFLCFFILFIPGLAFSKDLDLDNYTALTSDMKSSKVGELVTVFVVESINAESSAGTDVKKDTAIDARAYDSINSVGAGMNIGVRGEGGGSTSRSGRVKTQLSTRIVEVLPHGMYLIEGGHNLVINGEHQKIMLSGVIRAQDLTRNNAVFSYQIADANIEIFGEGDVSKAQNQNIISRIFQWLGLL